MNRCLSLLLSCLLLATTLAACGSRTPVPTGVVIVASPLPSATSTATPLSPTATEPPPTPIPPTSTPSPAATTALPSPTRSATEPTATPFPASTPTQAATSTPAPSATPTLRPTQPPLPSRDPTAVRVDLQRIVGGLEIPVGIAHAGDGSGRLFILEKIGRIRVVKDGKLLAQPFLDITDRVNASASEQGLLGQAFHPGYPGVPFFFVYYTGGTGGTVISRFSMSADPARADPASEQVLLTVPQPAGNHNGGHLAFGPDGYLYAGLGDGGGAGDQYGNGQNGQTLLGALLRLDVDGGQAYRVPPDNPFVGNPAVLDEIWALGLRNPWRFSFDRQTGELYIADVGQNQYEEINVQPASGGGGRNYGWPIMEAAHCFPEDQACNQSGLTLPVAEYDHSQGCSVTGGYAYRGRESPILTGIYLFGDYCSGRIWGLAPTGSGAWQVAQLAQADVRISAFGEDEDGEVYLLNMGAGELFKLAGRAR